MLVDSKKSKLIADLKSYKKKYVDKYLDLDESATRIMINEFLTEILGYKSLEEVKTEYMIKGTYADYAIQLNDEKHFLVEVKAMNMGLSDKHLRQAINYAANEGIEWVLLTNGRTFDLYRVIFGQPIENKLVFSVDLTDIKLAAERIQYLCKASVQKSGLNSLWNKSSALDPNNIASLLTSNKIIGILKKELKAKYKVNFEEADILNSILKVCTDCIEDVKLVKEKKQKKIKEQLPLVEVKEII